jgi:hypothetical protein
MFCSDWHQQCEILVPVFFGCINIFILTVILSVLGLLEYFMVLSCNMCTVYLAL